MPKICCKAIDPESLLRRRYEPHHYAMSLMAAILGASHFLQLSLKFERVFNLDLSAAFSNCHTLSQRVRSGF